MLSENIKQLRKSKGLTQEELAMRLNVVRQTVSKWEKGLSVPDAVLLKQLAEVLETEVSSLLRSVPSIDCVSENEIDKIAEQLARINEQLVVKNKRWNKIFKIVGIVILSIVVINLLLLVVSFSVGKAVYEKSQTVEYSISAEEEILNE